MKQDIAICETCQHLQITSGDRVPYGSTTAQLPDDWDCNAEWEDKPDIDLTIEKILNAEVRECPHYIELPRCPKHPESLMNVKWGCARCEQEMEEDLGRLEAKADKERMEAEAEYDAELRELRERENEGRL